MAKQNVPLLSIGNRGLISPKSLARVDLDRTRLSAETYNNFTAKTQGALTIRVGTKYMGSSLNDTGAEFVEFVASTEDVALCELTAGKMRIWLGDNAHELALLSRPLVDTTISLTDTGWSNTSIGGAVATVAVDVIPTMTAATTSGVTMTASSENTSQPGHVWRLGDDNVATLFMDTGVGNTTLPTWINVDFGSDTGNRKAVTSYSIRANHSNAGLLDNAPQKWSLLAGNYDTGTYATDTGKWTLEDTQGSETGWALAEKRTYELPGADTGTIEPRRHWRLNVSEVGDGTFLLFNELEMFTAATAQQVSRQSGRMVLNPTSIGATARAEKRVIVSDTGTEHSLDIYVERGPITARVGSTQRDDDYVAETSLGTGYHNLAFTPVGNFWVTLQSNIIADRIIGSISIGDSGTVEITSPWANANLPSIRYDQSADVVYLDCRDVRAQKIERRGTGRSWSVVDYAPTTGPFLPAASSTAKLNVGAYFGNTTLVSDIPVFKSTHVGSLLSVFHEGQNGIWYLGAQDAKTDAVSVTGVSDTGAATDTNERRIVFTVTGVYTGSIMIERSFDGPDFGFKQVTSNFSASGGLASGVSDTGTFTRTIDDEDDNVKVYYRTRMVSYTSGVANVHIRYAGGSKTGILRVTDYNSNQSVNVEVLRRVSDTGPSDSWRFGYWSDARGHPTAVALHGGRLSHAVGGNVFASVSDDYENFDDAVIGDAGPIIRTLGSGPVDRINYLVSLLRLIVGTSGSEITIRSSSLDEPLTADNSSAAAFSTQGSANVRALKLDARAIFVQRSGQRLIMIGAGTQGSTFGDYENSELTLLVPDLLAAGVVSIAVQRQPDTRLWCVLGDGTVAILTYEPQEEVICWTTWDTPTGFVEKAVCLPGPSEDAVFLHVRRTINGVTRRYLEKLAKESDCLGDSGLIGLMDCAINITDTGLSAAISAPHLAGEDVIVWGSDTGTGRGKDFSPDSDSGVQLTYALDSNGTGTIGTAVKHKSVGLGYDATWVSAKLAYAAQMGTALVQQKTVPQLGLALYNAHNNSLFVGTDTGQLDPLPRMMNDEPVDSDHIYPTLDMTAISIDGTWDPDIRLVLKAKAPRPITVLACIPTIVTNER